jgi:peptidoglycan/xylan/chitin deacetylase (PgdA/CDA1 family)
VNERDFVGHGADVPRVAWPDGARLALSLVVNYEEGSERSFAAGDGRNETLGEVARGVDTQYRDLATESVYEYGSRAGMHRLLRLFAAYDVPCTLFAAALALERNPTVCEAVRAAGHEVCGHGWRWSEDWTVEEAEERARIARAVASIERTCGARPVGWYSRWMASERTRRLLVEEGGFLYDSNAYNDDLPYYVDVGGHAHLVVPYTLTYNDSRYLNAGYSPTDFVDLCRRAVDELWAEGETHPRMLSIGLHPRWSGQAGRASAVREVIEHALGCGGVWFSPPAEIAAAWRRQHPEPRSTMSMPGHSCR